VPAKVAEIGLVDKILAAINCYDSSVMDQAGFLEEVQNLSSCLKLASNRSLLLIDEFGRSMFIL
jgi:DNA mismatch repair protein MSH5